MSFYTGDSPLCFSQHSAQDFTNKIAAMASRIPGMILISFELHSVYGQDRL